MIALLYSLCFGALRALDGSDTIPRWAMVVRCRAIPNYTQHTYLLDVRPTSLMCGQFFLGKLFKGFISVGA
jgi:hypothetical protein